MTVVSAAPSGVIAGRGWGWHFDGDDEGKRMGRTDCGMAKQWPNGESLLRWKDIFRGLTLPMGMAAEKDATRIGGARDS